MRGTWRGSLTGRKIAAKSHRQCRCCESHSDRFAVASEVALKSSGASSVLMTRTSSGKLKIDPPFEPKRDPG